MALATTARPATTATTPSTTGLCIDAIAPATRSMMPRNQTAHAEKTRRGSAVFVLAGDGNRKSAPPSSRSIASSWCC